MSEGVSSFSVIILPIACNVSSFFAWNCMVCSRWILSEISRAIFEAPMICPALLRMGDIVSEMGTSLPDFEADGLVVVYSSARLYLVNDGILFVLEIRRNEYTNRQIGRAHV